VDSQVEQTDRGSRQTDRQADRQTDRAQPRTTWRVLQR
jgi:hypothetical protein